MIQKTLQKYIFENLPQVGDFEISDVLVTVPTDSSHGDYMTSVALSASKKLGQNPQDFARELVSKVQSKKYSEIEKIEVAGPGFINITLTKEAVRSEIESCEKLQTKYSDKKVLVEHSSPNLFKPFHIGHLMNNVIGEAVTRIMREGGGNVSTTSFPSDVSLGIAKALYIVKKDGKITENSVEISFPSDVPLGISNELYILRKDNEIDVQENSVGLNDIPYLGEAYRRGIIEYENNTDVQEEVKNIANQIYQGGSLLYEKCKKINMLYFKTVTESLGSHFDSFIYESEAGVRGKEIILQGNPVKLVRPFMESQGAVVYIPDESRKDINTTVFINSQGNPTYAGKDVGLIDLKFDRFNPDTSIYITDNEQIPHFRTVFAAAEEIDQIWADRISKSLHVPHGRMTFKGQKMSSRLGGVPLAEDTIDAVLEEVRARSGEHIKHLGEEEQTKLQRDIALSALRIAILRAKPGSNINFDPETSLSFEGDSGPYLLYTHARCASLLDKAGVTPKLDDGQDLASVERKLVHYKEVLEIVVNDIAPQRLVTYLFELAQEFNSFYNDTTIIVAGDETATAHRLYIVSEVKKVLKQALHTLGINAPDRM